MTNEQTLKEVLGRLRGQVTAQTVLSMLSELKASHRTREDVEQWAARVIAGVDLEEIQIEGGYNGSVWDAITSLSGAGLREKEFGPYLFGDELFEEIKEALNKP